MSRQSAKLSTAEHINVYIKHHPDRGCKWSPECDKCPLPDCIWNKDMKKEVNDETDKLE
jgi:hypothetical protein